MNSLDRIREIGITILSILKFPQLPQETYLAWKKELAKALYPELEEHDRFIASL